MHNMHTEAQNNRMGIYTYRIYRVFGTRRIKKLLLRFLGLFISRDCMILNYHENVAKRTVTDVLVLF